MAIPIRALVYGGGAVGLGLASCLLKSRVHVDIVAREGTVSALREKGLVRTGIFGDFHAAGSDFGSVAALEDLPAGAYDFILVCVKSFDSSNAAKDLSQHESLFADKTKIVLFQNGWGNAKAFLAAFDKETVYNARVITGFQRPRPNEVDVTVHADAIHVGSLFGASPDTVEALAKPINDGDIPCETTTQIGKDIWAKMLYNCALNPVGAVLDVTYGELAAHKSSRAFMDGIIGEAFNVMTLAGYETHWDSVKGFLDAFYCKLVPDTAGHKSSMLQDIAAKKRTEIDALNGAVIELAARVKTPVPYNSIAYNLVKFIEHASHEA
ncbi:MAG: 2-dehydropantoate 2-reductase [Sedimentisphaerales bacterium]